MKNYFASVKLAIFKDYINLYLFSGTILLFLVDFLIWRFKLKDHDIYITTLNGIFPIRYLAIVFLLNTLLAVFSYEKEKEISYLLFSANVFIGILIFILELFYMINLNANV